MDKTRIDFKHFRLPSGIGGRETEGDARESFADILYTRGVGIRAHALAWKIYRSEGAEAYDREDLGLIRSMAERWCNPAFIDGLNKQISNQTKKE